MLRAVTLDAAGTLLRVQRPVGETYAGLAARHGIPVSAAAIGRAFRTVFPRMSPLAFGTADAAARMRQERDWWRTLVRSCLGAHGQHPAFGAFFDELFEHYRHGSAWALYPDVRPVLDALDAACVPVAVVSNFDSRLHQVLDELGVYARFRQVVCSSEAGAAKPAPAIFATACRALRVTPEQALHVGDDRRADLEGARSAGLDALWLRRDDHVPGDRDSVPDLTGLLSRLEARSPSASVPGVGILDTRPEKNSK
jgi:putative hydrolase of the HAD superfamily